MNYYHPLYIYIDVYTFFCVYMYIFYLEGVEIE